MDARTAARRGVERRVNKFLRHPEFRRDLVTNEVGQIPLIPVLVADTVGYTLDRLRELGGSATVVVGFEDGGIMLLPMTTGPAQPANEDEDCPLHPDSEVGMLLALLKQHRGTLYLRLVEAGEVLHVSDGELIDA